MVQLAAAVHGQQVAGKFTAQDRVDRTAQVAVAGGHILLLAVAQIAEADLRVGQRRVQDVSATNVPSLASFFKNFMRAGVL